MNTSEVKSDKVSLDHNVALVKRYNCEFFKVINNLFIPEIKYYLR